MKGHLDTEQLKSMDYKSLQALAKDMGVSAAGKAEDIITRIAAAEVDIPDGEKFTEEAAVGQVVKGVAGQQTGDGAEDTAGEPQTGQETAGEGAAGENTKDAEKPQEETGKDAGGVKVEVVTRYLDRQFNRIKEAGEVFTVDRDRAAVLLAEKVVKIKE